MKNHNGGVICCQGCYKIGYKSGREFAIEEFKEMINEHLNDNKPFSDCFNDLKKQIKELKSKNGVK